MSEIVFLVEDDLDGVYAARALGESTFTQADILKTLREMVRDAVHYYVANRKDSPNPNQ